ncbi:MAG: HAD family hydrolase [Candidatus Promineifilaceae bacterium]|jgi:HAD superfamily hydrolase (TIGR01549 family)
MTKHFLAILFDFDGTLLDSFPAHYQGYEVMLDHFGIEMTPELYKEIYTPNWFAMYEALGISEEQFAEADRLWLAEVARHEQALFPGVPSLLERLSASYRLGLVTAGSGARVRRDLAAAGIGDAFEVIVTADDITQPKPDPQGLQIALQRMDLAPQEALYVGDAREDYQMAEAAGVPFIGITGEFSTVTSVDGCPQIGGVDELESYLES